LFLTIEKFINSWYIFPEAFATMAFNLCFFSYFSKMSTAQSIKYYDYEKFFSSQ